MPSLTRIEAVERAALLTVHEYRISLDLPATGPHFFCDTTIRFSCATPGAGTFLDVQAAAVESVLLNGAVLATETLATETLATETLATETLATETLVTETLASDDLARLVDGRLPLTGLAADNELRIRARMAYSTDGEGMHRHVDPADGKVYLYAMSFLDAAPRWFACFDQPDLKATYDIEVRCPEDWTVLGNGAASELGAGSWRLATTRPLSTYFVTLAAGPYHSVRTVHDGVPLGLHARASLAAALDAEAEDMLEVTRRSLDRYHELFGIRYPFGEYHQAFVPDFNAGAMENPGCVTFRDQYVFRSAATAGQRGVRAATIAHEMAHMWFGDLVTMRWWDDLWLNESFAEYMAYRVCSEVTDYPAWTDFGIQRKDWGHVADQSPSTHPVSGNGSDDAAAALADFDGISYAKGASVLKQLAAHVGDDVFLRGLRTYFQRHSFGNAEFADLIRAWTDAGAEDLQNWAAQWLRTTGLDTLRAQVTDSAVTVTRTPPDDSHRPHTVLVAAYDSTGAVIAEQAVTLDGTPARMPVTSPVRLVVPDSADDTWAKLGFDGENWAAVAELLPRIGSPLTRVVLHNSIRDSVRDASLDPDFALDTLLAAVPAETVLPLVTAALEFATAQLAGPYAPPAERAPRRARIAAVAGRLLDDADAGSDTQLEAARAWIRACDEPRTLRRWLDGFRGAEGSAVPAGLVIDAELRWSLVIRLAGLGQLSARDIDAELDRDESTSGVVHAARARAELPTAEAKAAAWRILVEPSDTPAYEVYATASGFFDAGRPELTDAYLPRFFAEMPATAGHRHGWALGHTVRAAFPASATSPEVLALAAAAIARSDVDPAVRRSLIDGADPLRRAVASLNRYGTLPEG